MRSSATDTFRHDALWLAGGMLVYLLTRFVGLEQFPIYFFCDEAVHGVLARSLLQHDFRDAYGTFLPPYFQNDAQWNLSLSVYVHVLGAALFGTSVLVVRAASVLVGALAPLCVALILKIVFRSSLWWTAPLVLAALPAWFLHSRTAFETVMMVGFYAAFLLAYLLEREGMRRALPLAMLLGACTFYAYANGQGVMFATGVLLLASDFRHHLRRPPRAWLVALVFGAVLAAPYVRFRLLHPGAVEQQLAIVDSYWIRSWPLADKISTFASLYVRGLDPAYWFFPNDLDLGRQQMRGMGHLSVLALPFFAIGLADCLRRWRSSPHRAVLITVLAAPFPAAFAGILISRVLAMVVPAAILVCLGLDRVVSWTSRWLPRRGVVAGCALGLLAIDFAVTAAALVYGPTWYSDYGLYGMQYGAKQVFDTIHDELAASPDRRVTVSPTWANHADVFVSFFLPESERPRVGFQSLGWLQHKKRTLDPGLVFVLPAYEYEAARTDRKLVLHTPLRVLPYPDGSPGFYFSRIDYAPDADAVFAAEAAARRRLDVGELTLDGTKVRILHSRLDGGRLEDLFDGDSHTLVRGLEANPLVLQFDFARPRTIRGLKLQTATMDYALKVDRTSPSGGAPRSSTTTYRGLPVDPWIEFALPDGPEEIQTLRLEITQLDAGDDVHVHVRELSLE